jgi:hypothetical protein
MTLQQRECGLLEGGERSPARFVWRSAFVERRGVQVFEIRDELVDRGGRQDHARRRDVTLDLRTKIHG